MTGSDTDDLKTINYFVTSYFDLWDVVQTVENMIRTNAGMVNAGVIRSKIHFGCIPVGKKEEIILQITLPKRLIGVKTAKAPPA